MESQYITMIIKIVISLLLGIALCSPSAEGAALMGGHLDNKNVSQQQQQMTNQNYSTEYVSNGYTISNEVVNKTEERLGSRPAYSSLPLSASIEEVPPPKMLSAMQPGKAPEEIPDPSPLILPGYNLPEHLFNNGKPFYVEKDPITGKIDFNSKTPAGKIDADDDDYEYINDDGIDIYDKANIDRKDGTINGQHRPNDVNQLTPNFHDFLNLPVKYNSDKYVYPLISSSYANTKIQGNVNNHKYTVTTYKPTLSPNYFQSEAPTYYKTKVKDTAKNPGDYDYSGKYHSSISNSAPSTTPKPATTTKVQNLMHSNMNYPTYETTEDDYDGDYYTTPKTNSYVTTQQSASTSTTTTKRTLSLFEQLFGDYDEPKPTEQPSKPPSLFANLPTNKKKQDNEIVATNKPSYATTNHHMSASEQETYEYEDYEEPNTPVVETEHPTASKHPVRPDYAAPPQRTTTRNEISTDATVKYSSKITTTPATYNTVKQHHADADGESSSFFGEYDDGTAANAKPNRTYYFTTPTAQTPKVTSLPLGENHLQNSRPPPIIALTNNLREKLNNERVESSTRPVASTYQPNTYYNSNNNNNNNKPPSQVPMRNKPPSTSNIRIAHDQDTVSFVVGNQQNVEGPNKSSPYESNPFRPVYSNQNVQLPEAPGNSQSVSYTVQAIPEMYKPDQVGIGSAVSIQPIRNSEASLTIGMPLNNRIVVGQVMDEKLDLENDKIEFAKPAQTTGSKIVFPDEKHSTYPPNQNVPHKNIINNNNNNNNNNYQTNNREVLKLNSKPMFHQLPSDLTPPSESETPPLAPPPLPPRGDRPRPPWDPRPGHFYNGRPEYARPPRPSQNKNGNVYKRIDVLPNILPQFRPNAKPSMDRHGPPPFMRQPLLERPSNRPIGFFEKLQPPPPPPPKRMHDHMHMKPQQYGPVMDLKQRLPPIDDRVPQEPLQKLNHDSFELYQSPPKVHIANRRIGNIEAEVETLQMIQAKEANKNDNNKPGNNVGPPLITQADSNATEKPLYVVYPVNSTPLKLDVLDTDKKETVVIGTRAELPLPPSKINNNNNKQHDYSNVYEQKPLLNPKDRNDAPVLKPHTHQRPAPPTFPIKTDFPYILERPDPSVLNPPVRDVTSNNGNNLEDKYHQDHKIEFFESSNQWTSVEDGTESRIINNQKQNTNQISATLKTYTDKPIAVAYTPTEEYYHLPTSEKYSMPNYANPVISEIRPGLVDNADIHDATIPGSSQNSEITVSAVMHTHPQAEAPLKHQHQQQKVVKIPAQIINENHKSDLDVDTSHVPTKLDFEAPFHASVNIDSSLNQGWAAVKEPPVKSEIDRADVNSADGTTVAVESTSEFDIENFKPQLFGGFKPIYSYSESDTSKDIEDRQERKLEE